MPRGQQESEIHCGGLEVETFDVFIILECVLEEQCGRAFSMLTFAQIDFSFAVLKAVRTMTSSRYNLRGIKNKQHEPHSQLKNNGKSFLY